MTASTGFAVSEGGGRTLVTLPLRVVRENRVELRDLALGLLELGRRAFVFDFAECRYVDSAGMGMLVSLNNAIVGKGGTLLLTRLDDDLTTWFRGAKLDALFAIDEPQPHGARRGEV